MKTTSLLALTVLLTGLHGFANEGPREKDKESIMNSQKRMEERNNNASVLIGTGRGGAYDGHGTTEKDIRPQGKKIHKDYSDTDLKDKE